MANRNRAYYRKMRVKHIIRKKRIGWYWHYKYDGMYSKGKIHCSCGHCSSKTRNKSRGRRRVHANYNPAINYKHSDLKKVQSMNDKEKDWIEESSE